MIGTILEITVTVLMIIAAITIVLASILIAAGLIHHLSNWIFPRDPYRRR